MSQPKYENEHSEILGATPIELAQNAGVPLADIDKQIQEIVQERSRLQQILTETQRALIRLDAAETTLTLLALPYRAKDKVAENGTADSLSKVP